MPNKLIDTKKAQVGETITWFVATLIIIFLLTVSIFATSILSKVKEVGKPTDLPDKEKDYLATKSIVNFVDKNQDIIKTASETGDYIEVSNKFNPFLGDLSQTKSSSWHLIIRKNGEDEAYIWPSLAGDVLGYYGRGDYFYETSVFLNSNSGETLNLRFFCLGVC